MCGIGGVLRFDDRPVQREILDRMASSLAHRGPDDAGTWTDGPLGLVNRRLAVIDLSVAGHQPMTDGDGSLVITYNGEVFNFRELRDELTAAGHRFRSRTDTEVVLHAFQEWGEGSPSRFNGQFALAIWDRVGQRLFLARDRLGIKPLYYMLDTDRLIFGSEIKAILVHEDVPRRLCYPAMDQYFTFQNTLGERTLFDGIRLLSPGTSMTVHGRSGRTTTRRYWDPRPIRGASPPDPSAAPRAVRAALERAVERQLVADVPVGSYLSGGIDSGAVAAVARRSLGSLSTFTLGFDTTGVQGREREFDERAAARATAQDIRSDHHEAVLGNGEMERTLSDVVWHLEELRVGQSYPNYAIAAFARPYVKVVLSGTGGDELFAGYPWRYTPALTATHADEFIGLAYRGWQRLVLDEEKPLLFREEVRREADGTTFEAFRSVIERAGTGLRDRADFLDASLYFDLTAFLPGLLIVEDKLSMAHGLEVRVPFLDNDLVDLALSLPPGLKLREEGLLARQDTAAPTNDGKLVLREAMRPILSREAADRPKQGFSAPDAAWFRGASRDFVRDLLLDPRARIYEVLQPRFVRHALEEHWQGGRDRRLLIWSLLAFDEWLRRFGVAT